MLGFCIRSRCSVGPLPEITIPQEHDNLAGNVALISRNKGGRVPVVEHFLFEYSQDGINFFPIANETEKIFSRMLYTKAVNWDTSSLQSGQYKVKVTMTNKLGSSGSDVVNVFVTKLPVAIAMASPGRMSGEVIFDGSLSFDPDSSPITSWFWDFGDGMNETGMIINHTYSDITRSYFPTLTVTDTNSFTDTSYYELSFDPLTFQDSDKCACKNMTVRTSGKSGDYPVKVKNYDLGPFNNVNLSKPGDYRLAFAYEIVAELTEDSNPAKCSEGQMVKDTAHVDNVSENATEEGTGKNCGFAGTEFCKDDYTSPQENALKVHGGKIIRWYDTPGFNYPGEDGTPLPGLPKKDVQSSGQEGVWYKGAYIAEVTASSSEGKGCKCEFKVDFHVDKDGKEIQKPRLYNVSGVNCVAG